MDYDSIISSTYKWISLNKLIWFLLFFWIALPVFLLVPIGLDYNFFVENKIWLVNFLYIIIYFSLLVGFFTLSYHCLKRKNLEAKDLSITKVFDGLLLVLVQLWYIFVWNIHKSYRITQLLLLFGLPLLWFYSSYLSNWFIEYAMLIFFISYFYLVFYNYVRTSFSLTYFLSNDISIKNAIKKSWNMTHGDFLKIAFAYLVIITSVLVLFIVFVLIIGAVLNLILLNYFVPIIANRLTLFIASILALGPILISYHFAYFELYSQVLLKNTTSNKIKRVLARKVLNKEKVYSKKQKRKVSSKKKKKVLKKKKLKKKIIKKIPSNKIYKKSSKTKKKK